MNQIKDAVYLPYAAEAAQATIREGARSISCSANSTKASLVTDLKVVLDENDANNHHDDFPSLMNSVGALSSSLAQELHTEGGAARYASFTESLIAVADRINPRIKFLDSILELLDPFIAERQLDFSQGDNYARLAVIADLLDPSKACSEKLELAKSKIIAGCEKAPLCLVFADSIAMDAVATFKLNREKMFAGEIEVDYQDALQTAENTGHFGVVDEARERILTLGSICKDPKAYAVLFDYFKTRSARAVNHDELIKCFYSILDAVPYANKEQKFELLNLAVTSFEELKSRFPLKFSIEKRNQSSFGLFINITACRLALTDRDLNADNASFAQECFMRAMDYYQQASSADSDRFYDHAPDLIILAKALGQEDIAQELLRDHSTLKAGKDISTYDFEYLQSAFKLISSFANDGNQIRKQVKKIFANSPDHRLVKFIFENLSLLPDAMADECAEQAIESVEGYSGDRTTLEALYLYAGNPIATRFFRKLEACSSEGFIADLARFGADTGNFEIFISGINTAIKTERGFAFFNAATAMQYKLATRAA